MAPILLVHGWHGNPWNWGPHPSANPSPGTQTACGKNPKPGVWDGGFNFIGPLIDAHVPFDCTISINNKSTDEAGASLLQAQIIAKAQTFGSSFVHLVGHSKGGIWIRQMLYSYPEMNVGVYSVTLIDTPNLGSPGADLIVGAHQHQFGAATGGIQALAGLIQSFGGYDAGAIQLTTIGAARQNQVLGAPPQQTFVNNVPNLVSYYWIPADADTNNDGVINAANNLGDEGFPYGNNIANFVGVTRQVIANQQYQFLANTASVTWTSIGRPQFNKEGAGYRFKNDLVVQVDRMIYPPGRVGTQMVPNPTNLVTNSNGYLSFNHTTVLDPSVAQLVLTAVRQTQPVQ